MNHFSFYTSDAIMPPEYYNSQPEEDHQELEEPGEEQINVIVEKPTEKPTEKPAEKPADAPETRSAEEVIKTENETHAAALSTESTPTKEKSSYADSLMTTLLIVIPVLLVAVVSVVVAVLMKNKKAAKANPDPMQNDPFNNSGE